MKYPNFREVLRLGLIKERMLDYLREHNLRPSRRAIKIARAELGKRGKKHHGFEKDLSVREATANWQIIYGNCRVGGVITYIKNINNNSELLLLITVAGHEVEEITTMYFDGTAVTFSGATVDGAATGFYAGAVTAKVNLGSTSQSAIADLVTDSAGEWTSAHRQRGWAGVYLKLTWDAARFPNSIPEITFQVKGKKVYDPTTGLTAWSRNPALCIADYLMDTTYGMKVPSSEIYMGSSTSDIGSLWYARGVCEDSIPLLAGGTEPRYRLDGVSDTGMSHGDTLNRMLSAMGGRLTFSSGTFRFWPAKYRAPTITIDEDDIISELKISTLTSRRDSFNTIKGTFISAENNYENTDFPPVSNASYIALDNGEVITEDISLPYTTGSTMAQRLAKIELERIRQALTVQGTFKLRLLQAEPGDTINLSYTNLGWSPKIFEVLELSFVVDETSDSSKVFVVKATLRETASAVFDWSTEEQDHDVAPNSTLPNALVVAAPTGLTLQSGTTYLYQRLDGVIFSRIRASWTAPADAFVTSGGRIEIQHKKTADVSYKPTAIVSGSDTEFFILEVQDGVSYDVRIRAVSAAGTASSWNTVTGHTVVGKTAAPSDVSSITKTIEESGIRLEWPNISDLDLKEYEIRVGASWAAGVLLHKTKATYYVSPFLATGTYVFRIKARDTSLNYSATEATVTATITAPAVVQRLTSQVTDNHVMLDWDVPATIVQPIARYEIFKGDTFATSVRIAINDQTLTSFLEAAAGTFTYWIRAIDGAGNEGTETSIVVKVFAPPDYASEADAVFEAELGEATNVIVGSMGGTLFDALPVDDVIDTTSWFNPEFGVTLSNQRVGAFTDQRGVINNFTQATTANCPWVTRSDNMEERFRHTTDFTGYGWDASGYPASISGQTMTATAGAARHGLYYTSTQGERLSDNATSLYLVAHLQYINNQYAWVGESGDGSWRGAIVDLQNGTIVNTYNLAASSIAARSGGGYIVKLQYLTTACTNHAPGVWFSNTSSSASPPSFTAAGTEQITVHELHLRSTAAMDYDLANTSGISMFRGINGQKALHFQGAQRMDSTSLMSAMVGLSAKLVYVLFRPSKISATHRILMDADGTTKFAVYVDSGALTVRNYDGSSDTHTGQALTNGQITMARIRHDGVNIYSAIDTGSGFGAETSTASGASSSLGGALYFGAQASSNYFFGDIAALVSHNDSTLDYQTDAIEQVLRALYFEPCGRIDTGISYGTIIGPATVTETFQEHVDGESFTTTQDAIDAGYLYPFQPGPTSGSSVVLTENFGAALSNVIVNITWDEEILQSTATVTCTIETSTDGVTYTAYTNQSQAFISSMQYLRTTFEITDLTEFSAFRLSNIRRKVDVKIRTDSGTVSLVAGDSGGTQVNFNLDYYSVDSITLTLDNAAAVKSSVVFTGGVSPVGFKALAFNAADARVSTTAYWQARGIVAD